MDAISIIGYRCCVAAARIHRHQLRHPHPQNARENQQAVETVVEMGKRLVNLQADIQALQHKQQPADLGSNYKAYSQAAELLTRGVSMKEVMERCQLSKGEAELLAAMTQRSKNAK